MTQWGGGLSRSVWAWYFLVPVCVEGSGANRENKPVSRERICGKHHSVRAYLEALDQIGKWKCFLKKQAPTISTTPCSSSPRCMRNSWLLHLSVWGGTAQQQIHKEGKMDLELDDTLAVHDLPLWLCFAKRQHLLSTFPFHRDGFLFGRLVNCHTRRYCLADAARSCCDSVFIEKSACSNWNCHPDHGFYKESLRDFITHSNGMADVFVNLLRPIGLAEVRKHCARFYIMSILIGFSKLLMLSFVIARWQLALQHLCTLRCFTHFFDFINYIVSHFCFQHVISRSY